MRRQLRVLCVVLGVVAVTAGCAAGKAFRQGDAAMRSGDLDQAVVYYRTAVQSDPDNPNYKIALERAMLGASRAHFERGREFEAANQLEAARGEYQMAAEFDPSNRTAAGKVAELDQTIRDRNEAARPRPAIEQLRAQARAASAVPMLNPATDVVNLRFTNTNLRDILDTIGSTTGINISYDRDVAERLLSLQLDGVTVEEALNQLMLVGQLSYKVLNEQSILVFPDTPQKHTQYDDQVIQTFYVSHADATELVQILSALIRLPGLAIQPALQANATANTIVVRGTRSMVEIIERVIAQNDKPKAEVVFDIEILEVDRSRVKAFGLNLSQYAVGGIFSPAVAPGGGDGSPAGSTPPTSVQSPPPFNLNTISRGVNTADFYLAVPTAFVRFLESDTRTKLVAKPQLRGAEGSQLTLNLGDEVPVVTTSYTPIATGGAGVNPLNSFQLKPVGINIDITPRVTVEGDVLITLNLESSSRGADVLIAGTSYPSFGSRRVSTQLRLRDGEPNLLAGLLRDDERRLLSGFPGAIHVPILRELFSNNDQEIAQTDIVMLMTPHIVRTHGITEEDLRPIFIGSQQNLGLGGPPPLIAPPAEPAPTAPPPAAAAVPGASSPRSPAAAAGRPASPQLPMPGGTTLAPPPGASPVPGSVLVPPPPVAVPPAPAPAAAPLTPTPAAPPPPASAAPAGPPITTPGLGLAQVILSLPGAQFRVGAGSYTVPLSVTNASRLSTVTLTLTFDPALLSVRAVQEGSFMRSGGVNATFIQDVAPGRVDITIARTDDATGASGTGLLAAVLMEPIAPGTTTLTVSGAATGPGGTPMGLQFQPVTFAIQE